MGLIWKKKKGGGGWGGAHAPSWSIKIIGVIFFEPLKLGLNI